MLSQRRVGYVTCYVSCFTPHLKRDLCIATMSMHFISPPTRSSINARSTQKLIFTSCGKKLPGVKFMFYMCPPGFKLQIFSPKVFHAHCLKISDPVSTSDLLQFRLRGCISCVYSIYYICIECRYLGVNIVSRSTSCTLYIPHDWINKIEEKIMHYIMVLDLSF